MTKLAAALPKGDQNGLGRIASELIGNPLAQHVAVVVLDCKSITTDNDTGDVIPTARIRHIEPLDGAAAKTARGALAKAYSTRTGQHALPFDPATGEVTD